MAASGVMVRASDIKAAPHPVAEARRIFREKILKSCPSVEHPSDLPTISGIYFCAWSSGWDDYRTEIQYIGKSVDLKSRFSGHRIREYINEPYFRIFWKERDRKFFSSLEHEEGFYIALLAPRMNRSVKFGLY